MKSIPNVRRGTFRIIRVDGTESEVTERPTICKVNEAIGAVTIDTVMLTQRHGEAEVVMCVDDTGMVDGKPINQKATKLYHSICTPGNLYSIHGDVAIVNDKDFA